MREWPYTAQGRLTGIPTQSDVLKPLSGLADGTRFRFPIKHEVPGHEGRFQTVGWTYGIKLWHNECRCRVRMDGQQTQVTFSEHDGTMRIFESNGATEMSYPTMMEVVAITYAGEPGDHEPSERETDMADAQKQATGIQARYDFQMKQLAKAEATQDAAKVEATQGRIDAILTEAAEAGVVLGDTPAPAVEAVQRVVTNGKAVKGSKAATPVTPKAAVAKVEKVKKEKKLPTTQDCLCGCGRESGGKFAPGHDATVKSMLKKVERGEMKFAELPPTVQAVAKFAGKAATAGKEGSDYRITQSPVKFPGRDDITIV